MEKLIDAVFDAVAWMLVRWLAFIRNDDARIVLVGISVGLALIGLMGFLIDINNPASPILLLLSAIGITLTFIRN
jgi:hypothetical protein